jgi:dolichol-phosphate mannosyltransferase
MPMGESKKLSIIIPVYNEEKTVGQVLKKVLDVNLGKWLKEIIVIDDGSTDGSKFEVQSVKLDHQDKDIRVFHHRQNLGKGAAIKTALKHVRGDAVVIQDADLEYDPVQIVSLCDYYQKHNCAAVFGSRNLTENERSYWHYYLGVRLLSLVIQLLYGARVTDPYTCYKLVDARVLKSLKLESRGFEIEAEMTVKLLARKVAIDEVPIRRYHPRSHQEGKKIRAIDGLYGLLAILKYRFPRA